MLKQLKAQLAIWYAKHLPRFCRAQEAMRDQGQLLPGGAADKSDDERGCQHHREHNYYFASDDDHNDLNGNGDSNVDAGAAVPHRHWGPMHAFQFAKRIIKFYFDVRRRHLKISTFKQTHFKSPSLEIRNAESCTMLGAIWA